MYPASHRDHLSLFAGNDDKFNSHSEDNQDLAPDSLRHSGLWFLGIGHTGNPSDHKHSAHRLQSFKPDSVVQWSILLNHTLLELRSELEHALVSFFRTRYRPDASNSSRRDNSTHRAAILLRHPDPGEPFPACCSGIVSGFVLVLTTLSFRDIIVISSLVQERRRSHIRRGNSFPLLVLLLTAFPSLLLEKEKGNGTCLKKKHISLRSFNMTSA